LLFSREFVLWTITRVSRNNAPPAINTIMLRRDINITLLASSLSSDISLVLSNLWTSYVFADATCHLNGDAMLQHDVSGSYLYT